MDSLNIFGISLPLLPLLIVSAMMLMSLVNRWQKNPVVGFSDAILHRLLLSLVAARLGFVAQHLPQYQGQWLQVVDIRDRGFDSYSLMLVFSLLLMQYAYLQVAARRVLLLSLPVAMLWIGASFTVYRFYHPMPTQWPSMTFQTLQGQQLRLSDRTTTLTRPATDTTGFTVVNLWASWCPPCRAEMPVLIQAQQQYPQGRFILLNQGETQQQVEQFLQQQGLEFHAVWLDPQRTMGRWVGQQTLPLTLVFDQHGKLIDGHAGLLSSAMLADKLQGL
ncbi:MAG: TlpA family protein disulfide reductase [Gammaproteobacteria bacterium]|nr:TlpA family protein disulfide reductase [Gammaproteobacteria bacterium]